MSTKWNPELVQKLKRVLSEESEETIAAYREIENIMSRREGICHD